MSPERKRLLRFCVIFACLCGFVVPPSRADDLQTTQSLAEMHARAMREIMELRDLERTASKIRTAPQAAIPPDLEKPIHIMLMFVDHWEPSSYNGEPYESEAARLADFWLYDYRQMAAKHHDADGRMPQHTWFTFQLDPGALDRIAQCAFLGLGEVEVHLHHGTADDNFNDNTGEFYNKMRNQLATLQGRGACLTAEAVPRTFFGFIHGDWALDNSRMEQGIRKYCGVNGELNLLRALGCYSDFTFPSGLVTQPTWTNKIFVSKDSNLPKSYDDSALIRELLAFGAPVSMDELMIFEGPGTRGLDSNIDELYPPTLERMDEWVGNYVHVPGRNNWIFVKMYTHSAYVMSTGSAGIANMVGAVADRFYTDIETKYNDGTQYQLHYVTAREAYNIVCAAVDGLSGNPGNYRDYLLPKPANRHLYVNTPYRLLSYDPMLGRTNLEIKQIPPVLEFWTNDYPWPYAILEANTFSSTAFRLADVQTSTTAQARLVVRDATPSKYYRIILNPMASRAGWQMYP